MNRKGDVVYVIYVQGRGWYDGQDYTDYVECAWSTPDADVAKSTADLVGGAFYTLHVNRTIGPAYNANSNRLT